MPGGRIRPPGTQTRDIRDTCDICVIRDARNIRDIRTTTPRKAQAMQRFGHIIDGQEVQSISGETFPSIDP